MLQNNGRTIIVGLMFLFLCVLVNPQFLVADTYDSFIEYLNKYSNDIETIKNNHMATKSDPYSPTGRTSRKNNWQKDMSEDLEDYYYDNERSFTINMPVVSVNYDAERQVFHLRPKRIIIPNNIYINKNEYIYTTASANVATKIFGQLSTSAARRFDILNNFGRITVDLNIEGQNDYHLKNEGLIDRQIESRKAKGIPPKPYIVIKRIIWTVKGSVLWDITL